MKTTTQVSIAVLLAALLSFGSIASAQPAQQAEPSARGAPAPPAPPGQEQPRAAPPGSAEAPRPGRSDGGANAEQGGGPAPAQGVFGAPNPRPEPNVVLDDLVRRVAEASGRDFLIHAFVPQRIYVRGTVQQTPTYAQLLSILRNNNLTIFVAEDIVNIVPDSNSRSMPTRVVQEDDDRIPDDEIVTRVIRPQHVPAVQLVPLLRPMLPQEAHLSAVSNALVIVDRYANVKRISEVIRTMDVESAE